MKRFILSLLLLASSVCQSLADKGFDWYPMTNASYYTVLTNYNPIADLVEAINERCLVAGQDELEFIENVNIQFPEVDNEAWASIFFGPYPDGDYMVLGDPPCPYFFEKVPSYGYQFGDGGTFGLGYSLVRWTDPAEIQTWTVTNQFGRFVVTNNTTGVIATGDTFVTRSLINTMWDKIEDLAPNFISYYTNETLLGEGGSTSWFSSQESILKEDRELIGDYNDAWGLSPYILPVTLPTVWQTYNIPVFEASSNYWGIITNGTVEYYPVNDSNVYNGAVIIADGICTNASTGKWKINFKDHNGSVYWPAGPSPDYNPYNVDYKWYLDNPTDTNRLRFAHTSTNTSFNPNIEITFRGKKFIKTYDAPVGQLYTNWNGVTPLSDGDLIFTNYYTSNAVYTLTEQTESLKLGEYSTNVYVHLDPDSITITGTANYTNETVTLLWNIGHFYEQASNPYLQYRLYAEEFNRMVQALDAMRYTLYNSWEKTDNYVSNLGPYGLGYVGDLNTNYISTNSTICIGSVAGNHPWVTNNQTWCLSAPPKSEGGPLIQSYTSYDFPLVASLGIIGGEYDDGQSNEVKRDPYTPQNASRSRGIPAWWPTTNTYKELDSPYIESTVLATSRPPNLVTLKSEVRSLVNNGLAEDISGYPGNLFYQKFLPFALTYRILQIRSAEVNSGWDYDAGTPWTDYDLFGEACYYKENAAYADTTFNVLIPSNTPPGTIYAAYGDFTPTWDGARIKDATELLDDLYKGSRETGFLTNASVTLSISVDDSDELPVKSELENPDETVRFTCLPMKWDGNGKLTANNTIHIEQLNTFTTDINNNQWINGTVYGTDDNSPDWGTRVLTRPSFEYPTLDVRENLMDIDVQGYTTTHLYLIIKWDFTH